MQESKGGKGKNLFPFLHAGRIGYVGATNFDTFADESDRQFGRCVWYIHKSVYMSRGTVYLFLFDGFSDWEPSYVIAELNKSDRYQLITFSIDGKPVKSMGGLTVIPDTAVHDIKPEQAEMIILPGGDAWQEKKYREMIPVVEEFHRLNKKIAAICGATLLLSDMGLLDNVKHTSNGDFFLKRFSPNYRGEKHYVQQPAVSDKNIITASGIYPIEFAKEIFQDLNVMERSTVEKWFQLFKNGVWIE